jgi:hypothetical protein
VPDLTRYPPDSLQHVDWEPVIAGLAISSLVMLAASVALLPWLLLRLPPDYLHRVEHERRPAHTWRHRALHVARNGLALVVALAGVLMLVLPGQGLLTILAAAILSDLPGKHRVVRAILGRNHVLRAVNALRRRGHRPPLMPHT